MKKLPLYLSITAVAIALLLPVLTAHFMDSGPRVAYVRSAELVYGYAGMEEAHQLYQGKTQQWQANIDTLKSDYNKRKANYEARKPRLNPAEQKKEAALLEQKRQEVARYAKVLEKRAREEDEEITEMVLNQINVFVEKYARAHGYDLILGTTPSGNILYGRHDMDITDEVLKALNHEYRYGEE